MIKEGKNNLVKIPILKIQLQLFFPPSSFKAIYQLLASTQVSLTTKWAHLKKRQRIFNSNVLKWHRKISSKWQSGQKKEET